MDLLSAINNYLRKLVKEKKTNLISPFFYWQRIMKKLEKKGKRFIYSTCFDMGVIFYEIATKIAHRRTIANVIVRTCLEIVVIRG